jgi:predicted RNase H-like nuclease (RuvC/YqgF family)
MMTQINNDSIVAQLTREQLRTQQLLEELKKVKDSDAREIARLKKELATVRDVLRSYIRQVDSLNRINESLRTENSHMRDELEASSRQIAGLNNEKASLSEKVAIAAQLDATGLTMTPLNKRNKAAKKMKDCKQIQVSFNIAKNVTARNGQRTLYVRIQTPNGDVLTGGTFAYESKQIEYSMKKVVEYTGEETSVVTYWPVNEFLGAGDYRVSVFADGQMIGTRTFSFEK